MIIAYDARPLQPKTRHWGVGVVIDNLLARLSPNFEFLGIAHQFAGAAEEGIKTWPKIPFMNSVTFEGSIFFLKQLDIYWATNHFLPALNRWPSVVTVHDLLLLKYPSDQQLTRYLSQRFASSLRKANRIVADSRTTADDLVAAFPNVCKKLEIGLLGWYAPSYTEKIEPCADAAGFDFPYVVMLGAHRPRKNLPLAMAAVLQLRDRGSKLKLLVTGDVHPSFQKLVSKSKEFVTCVGVLPRPDLYSLLQRAQGLMFPSFYEGFGFPMLEAMTAGCPVLALDTPINREIAGDAALLLPPEACSWSRALHELQNTASLCDEMREKGLRNLRRFSWDSTAAIYSDVFKDLSKNGRV